MAGKLRVEQPADAPRGMTWQPINVYLDTRRVGDFPLRGGRDFEVPAGRHELRVRQQMHLFSSPTLTVDVPEGGSLRVICTPNYSTQSIRAIFRPGTFFRLEPS
jgi:hypothetical protein